MRSRGLRRVGRVRRPAAGSAAVQRTAGLLPGQASIRRLDIAGAPGTLQSADDTDRARPTSSGSAGTAQQRRYSAPFRRRPAATMRSRASSSATTAASRSATAVPPTAASSPRCSRMVSKAPEILADGQERTPRRLAMARVPTESSNELRSSTCRTPSTTRAPLLPISNPESPIPSRCPRCCST